MSLPRPIRPYHFQADLIWWDGPFKYINNLQFHMQHTYYVWKENIPFVQVKNKRHDGGTEHVFILSWMDCRGANSNSLNWYRITVCLY
jgi:hypothetical protein